VRARVFPPHATVEVWEKHSAYSFCELQLHSLSTQTSIREVAAAQTRDAVSTGMLSSIYRFDSDISKVVVEVVDQQSPSALIQTTHENYSFGALRTVDRQHEIETPH
jgi:hypothetical protein